VGVVDVVGVPVAPQALSKRISTAAREKAIMGLLSIVSSSKK
jgi:hypothetical protein